MEYHRICYATHTNYCGTKWRSKTTAAPALLQQALHVDHFVNADTIASGLSAYAPEKAAIQAGKAMLTRLDELAKNGENFAFETTLASRSFAHWIAKLKEIGYSFHLTYILLDAPDLAVARVAERVKLGGHSVPEETIRRRYNAGLKNFFNLYKPIADSWKMYDNTNINNFALIASKIDDTVIINNESRWKKLVETYDET